MSDNWRILLDAAMTAFSTDTRSSMDACPPLEDIAAFLDGTLSPEERERITAHLASCEKCYEIFLGVVQFQEDTRGEVAPFPFAGEKVRPRVPRWLALAASIFLVAALGFFVWRALMTPPRIVLAEVARPFEEDPRISTLLYQGETFRGEGDALGQRSWFMAGVRLLDLRLSLEAEEPAKTTDILQDLATTLSGIPTMESLSEQFSKDSEILREHPEELRPMLPDLLRQEEETQEALSTVDVLDFPFGLWAEAGRLAALTESAEFFNDRNNRRFLDHLFQETPWAGDEVLEDVPADLHKVQEIWKAGKFRPEDYETLGTHFGRIIEAYDTSDDF